MDDNDHLCPLCCEELDISDQQFFPCKCGYQVCMWCWHRIREQESGLCPACRTPYGDDPHEFSAVDVQEVLKANKEKEVAAKREKHRQHHSQNSDEIGSHDENGTGPMDVPKDRTQLANMRVIRRNLVYAVGLPPTISNEDTLRKPDYFGQYGKISKIVLNRNQASNGDPRRTSASAYVTFLHKEDTLACILALDGFYLENRNIRASYGTSKYCSAFIKNVRCNNPECTYLHEMGATEDTFTKQEIQAGYVTSGRDVLARQQQIVQQALSASSQGSSGTAPRRKMGGGGPSGTGKSASHPVFPPPEYDEPTKAPSTHMVPQPPPGGPFARATSAPGVGSATIPTMNSKLIRSTTIAATAAKPSPASASGPRLGSHPGGAFVPVVGRKGPVIGAALQGGSSIATASAPVVASQGATAASVVAGVHSISTVTPEAPAPHTTLTTLTPLKRAPKNGLTPIIGKPSQAEKPTIAAMFNAPGAGAPTKQQVLPTKGIEPRRDGMGVVARQQPDDAQKLLPLRKNGNSGGATSVGKSNIPSAGRPHGAVGNTTDPNPPESNLLGSVPNVMGNGSNRLHPLNGTTAPSLAALGGDVIVAPSGKLPSVGTIGSSKNGTLGPKSLMELNENTEIVGGRQTVGLGSLGGEVFNGPLLNNGDKAAVGAGVGKGGKWNSLGKASGNNAIGSSRPVGVSGLWGAEAKPGPHAIGGIPVNNGGGIIGSGMSSGNGGQAQFNSGSSALASILGINLPTGSDSLRASSSSSSSSTSLWNASPPAAPVRPIGSSFNGGPLPSQGVIGPTGNSLIGGVPIGRGNAVGGGGGGGGGYVNPSWPIGSNKNDIALLQSLLPGVHITSGNEGNREFIGGTVVGGIPGGAASNPLGGHAGPNSSRPTMPSWGFGVAPGSVSVGDVGRNTAAAAAAAAAASQQQPQRQSAAGNIW